MTTAINSLLRTATTLQAAGLVGANLAFLRKKKKRAGDFVGMAGTNIVGSALIREQANFLT